MKSRGMMTPPGAGAMMMPPHREGDGQAEGKGNPVMKREVPPYGAALVLILIEGGVAGYS